MKIGDAQKIYRANRATLVEQRRTLVKRRDEVNLKLKTAADEKERELFGEEAATLELSINEVNEKFDKNQEVLDALTEKYAAIWNSEVAKQQGDAMNEAMVDLSKILEVARRISKGGKVPSTDEKKLMDYSMEMYMAAKNAGMMAQMRKRKHKEYDSLWEEEEEKKEYDPQGKAENAEAGMDLPNIDIAAPAAMAGEDAPAE
ncbi:MAG: hypothetical protein K2G89_01605 [Lachnospiraceae bacterium]|nr:hypothetical protein [Lachnospiraceae bacterium]